MRRKYGLKVSILQLPQLIFELYMHINASGSFPFITLLVVLSGPLSKFAVPLGLILLASFSYADEVGLAVEVLLLKNHFRSSICHSAFATMRVCGCRLIWRYCCHEKSTKILLQRYTLLRSFTIDTVASNVGINIGPFGYVKKPILLTVSRFAFYECKFDCS